jgi:chorismate mutase
MTEQQQRLAREREEIAKRVAIFKATQEKFRREREEYCVTTLQNACRGFERPPFWFQVNSQGKSQRKSRDNTAL